MSGNRRILCVGNRMVPGDDAGPRVHDHLLVRGVPPGVDLVDGGLAGLDLLRWVEGAERVVFVDSVSGIAGPGEVVVLGGQSLMTGEPVPYGHAGGLAYLLAALPAACEGPVPALFLVGVEGVADERAIAGAAETSLRLAGAELPSMPEGMLGKG